MIQRQKLQQYNLYYLLKMQSGLLLLEKQLKISENRQQITPIPIYSFINQINSNLKEYAQHQPTYPWAHHLLYHKKASVLITLVKSWIFYLKHSLQAQIMSSLLLCTDLKKLRMFLRLRKYIVQLTNIQMLDEILLRHQDVITIIHRMFSNKIKTEIINGIKQIFVSFKIPEAKIYSCVFIQYILSVYDSINSYEQIVMADSKHNHNLNTIDISHFSTITKFNSEFHKENGLYRKIDADNAVYTVIQTKFVPTNNLNRASLQRSFNKTQALQNQCQNIDRSHLKKHYYETRKSQQSRQQDKENNRYVDRDREREQKKMKNMYCDMSQSLNQGNEMRIEQQNYFQDKSSIQCINKSEQYSKESLKELSNRNREFKQKILSSKEAKIMSKVENDSINETINIIHNSIVRNRRNRS